MAKYCLPDEQNARDIVSLKEYFSNIISDYKDRVDERFNLQDKAVQAALNSAERAVTKAETATEKRFEGVNEFRSALSDQSQNLLSRSEYATAHQSLIEKIDGLTTRVAAMEGGNKDRVQAISFLIGGAGVLVALIVGILYIVKK
jgi:hypothetical protein